MSLLNVRYFHLWKAESILNLAAWRSRGVCVAFWVVDLVGFGVITSFWDVSRWKSRKIVRDLSQAQRENSYKCTLLDHHRFRKPLDDGFAAGLRYGKFGNHASCDSSHEAQYSPDCLTKPKPLSRTQILHRRFLRPVIGIRLSLNRLVQWW